MKINFIFVVIIFALGLVFESEASQIIDKRIDLESLCKKGQENLNFVKKQIIDTKKKIKKGIKVVKYKGSKIKTKEILAKLNKIKSLLENKLRFCKGNKGGAKTGFCKKSELALGDGTQIKRGFCSETIQGEIPSVNKMPSTIIINPKNGELIRAKETFTVRIRTNNVDLGLFDDPEKHYYLEPQELNAQGIVKGHQHVAIQRIDSNFPPDAQNPAFFKGLNDKGIRVGLSIQQSVDVEGGLVRGLYRICTMGGSFGHQPFISPVAKRGSQDDCIRVRVK